MTTIEDVYEEALAKLRAETPIPWMDFFVPDDQDAPDVYGVLQVIGPFEVGRRNQGIVSAALDPMGGTLLAILVARTPDAMRYESRRTTQILRGWKPLNTTELTTRPARGYQPIASKNPPTLFVHNVLFEFTTNLDGEQ